MRFSRTKYFNDHSKYSLKWFGWKIIKTIFTPPPLLLQHRYVLTSPRNRSYTLGQVILARKRQSSCTTRTKSALTILRTASTWTRPTHHWCVQNCTGIGPTLPLTTMCGSSMLSCSLLLAAYECGNTSAAAVYDVSLTTVDIKSLLPCITLVAPKDYWLCVSVCLCVSVFWR